MLTEEANRVGDGLDLEDWLLVTTDFFTKCCNSHCPSAKHELLTRICVVLNLPTVSIIIKWKFCGASHACVKEGRSLAVKPILSSKHHFRWVAGPPTVAWLTERKAATASSRTQPGKSSSRARKSPQYVSQHRGSWHYVYITYYLNMSR